MDNNKIEKPTVLVVEETKAALIKYIQDSKLPAFIVEPILQNLLIEVRMSNVEDYKRQKAEYEKMLKESYNEQE